MSARLPTEANEERPRLRSPERSMNARPSAPLCERNPTFPGVRHARSERRVQPRLGRGVDDAEAVGSDQPHARLAADARAAGAGARRPPAPASANPAEITTTAGTPCSAHSRATSIDRGGRNRDHRQVDRPGDLADGADTPAPTGRPRPRVDGIERCPSKPPSRRLWKISPPTVSALARRADHGDRRGHEEVVDRRGGGDPVAVLEALHRLRGERGREARRGSSPARSGPRPASRSRGTPRSSGGSRAAPRLRRSSMPCSLATSARWARQDRPQATALELVGDREGDLGPLRAELRK